MAPFFPPDRMSDFLNVQRLFGVNNVIKLISKFGKPGERAAAMRSIKQEANVRARDPILGSYGIVLELNKHILHARTLLNNLCQQLTFCRAQHYCHFHSGFSFGTNSMHAPSSHPLLLLPPPAPAPTAAYSLPWLLEDRMEQQQQKDFPNAWLTAMVAETPVSM
ncbi:hypothetical protein AMTR_s00036p00021270 [Amborella trichopoda]|uniref:LOB domain-containing protein n=1 Tax=Amborella trichopoda TaxID=13333 RepID=U5D1K8_AMBTC|nr:hypothetical protein AMTR_s00036p00021270 [Amborella trichopoda]